MLNYIWLGLIVIGVTIAIAIDVSDITTDKYRNNQPFAVQVVFPTEPDPNSKEYQDCEILFTKSAFDEFYRLDKSTNDTLKQKAKIKFTDEKKKCIIQIGRASCRERV